MSYFLSRMSKIITECQMMSLNVDDCLEMSNLLSEYQKLFQNVNLCLNMSNIAAKRQILSQNMIFFLRMSKFFKCPILSQNVYHSINLSRKITKLVVTLAHFRKIK